MAIKGVVAKFNMAKKMEEVFGKDWIGEVDKKYYVWADDGGERVQIAITMTCPKTFVGEGPSEATSSSGKTSVMESAFSVEDPKPKTAEVSEQEKKNIADMLKKLGL